MTPHGVLLCSPFFFLLRFHSIFFSVGCTLAKYLGCSQIDGIGQESELKQGSTLITTQRYSWSLSRERFHAVAYLIVIPRAGATSHLSMPGTLYRQDCTDHCSSNSAGHAYIRLHAVYTGLVYLCYAILQLDTSVHRSPSAPDGYRRHPASPRCSLRRSRTSVPRHLGTWRHTYLTLPDYLPTCREGKMLISLHRRTDQVYHHLQQHQHLSTLFPIALISMSA